MQQLVCAILDRNISDMLYWEIKNDGSVDIELNRELGQRIRNDISMPSLLFKNK